MNDLFIKKNQYMIHFDARNDIHNVIIIIIIIIITLFTEGDTLQLRTGKLVALP